MQSQMALLFLLLCVGEELSTGSSVAVSSPPLTTLRGSQGGRSEAMSGENAASVEGIREMEDHGQNIEGQTGTPPLLPELKENAKNGTAIMQSSIAAMHTSMAVIGASVPTEFPLTLTPLGPMRRTVSSEGGAVTQQPITALASTDSSLKLQSENPLAPGGPPERMRKSGPGPDLPSEGSGRSLRLRGAGPRSRRRRSWLWNQFFVIEEYRGPEPVLIGRLHTDMDRGDGLIRYVLEGEGVGSVFVIDEQTGNIHVTKALDREEKDEYRLVATATDRQTGRALEPSSQFLIKVQDINDNPPVFKDGPYSATVPEMANIGTSIIQVTASDADDPTYGNSARLVYAITQGQQHFSVDPQTGVLRTAVPDLDRETQDEYQVVLEAKDMGGHLGGLSGTTTVTVRLSDVNDSPPRFRKSAWSFSVSELAAPGVEVGRLSATDADLGENAALEFAILEAEEAATFNVSGRDQEAVIVLNKLLDYESQSSFSFSVEVTNPVVDAQFIRRGPFKDRATVRVMVLNADEPPRFSRSRYRLDVSENCPPVCSVGRVSAVDPDTGQSSNIRYSIDPQSDPEALFRIASDSGFITTVMELDREREQWHNITVIATQRDNPNLVTRVVVAIETLDQNDNAPELDRQYATSVCDSSSPGQVVQILRAVDKDPGGQDAPIHFSIPPESGSARNLTIRESGGATASLVLRSALRPLSGSSPSLLTLLVPVVLRDGASGLTNTGTVTVTVCPCLGGGMRAEERGRQRDGAGGGWERHAVCLPLPADSPSLVFSVVTLLALLAGAATLLVVCALSLSLRHQKRDSLSSFEEDDVRENIITYDDEGGGEADTAAFDITALQSMQRVQRIQDSRNIWFTQRNPPRARTYSCSRNTPSALNPCRPGSAPLYGRLCYGLHTLPVRRGCQEGPLQAGALQLTKLTYGLPGHLGGGSLIVQNQGTVDAPGPGAARISSVTHAGSGTEGPEHAARGGPPTERQEASSESQQNQEPKEKQPGSALTGEAVIRIDCGPSASSSHSESSSSSSQLESQQGASPTQTNTAASNSALVETDTESSAPSLSEKNESGISPKDSSKNQASLPGDSYSIVGSLNQGGGGIPVTGATLYPGGAELLNIYGLGRRDLTPQLLPLPGGMLGYGPAWACGRVLASEGAGPNSLPLRMEEFLKFRLDQVTFDLSQPPYDSLQTYEFEGGDSRAESLSSLESDGEREEKTAERMDEFGQKFDRLVEIIKERDREKEKERGEIKEKVLLEGTPAGGRSEDEVASQTNEKQRVERQNEENRWDF